MDDKLLLGLGAFFLGRSRRLRWLVPAIPLAVGAYRLLKQSRSSRELPTVAPAAPAVIPVELAPEAEPATPAAKPKRRRKRSNRAHAVRGRRD